MGPTSVTRAVAKLILLAPVPVVHEVGFVFSLLVTVISSCRASRATFEYEPSLPWIYLAACFLEYTLYCTTQVVFCRCDGASVHLPSDHPPQFSQLRCPMLADIPLPFAAFPIFTLCHFNFLVNITFQNHKDDARRCEMSLEVYSALRHVPVVPDLHYFSLKCSGFQNPPRR